MSKKAWIWIIVAIIVIGGAWALASRSGNKQTNQSVKIGVILPLTGDYASIGSELQKGVELAVKQLDAQGMNITAVYEDDQFDPTLAASAAQKVVNVDGATVGMVWAIEEAHPIMPIFNNAKIPLVISWDSNNEIASAGSYIFSNGFSTERAGASMADYAFNTLKLRKIAVLSHVDTWSSIISKSFVDQFTKDGGSIVYNDSVQVGTTDFRTKIAAIKTSGAEGVYAPLIPFDSVSFLQQAKQLGLEAQILSGDALIQDAIDAAGAAANGTYFTNAHSDNPDLAAQYKQAYGADSAALDFVGSGYDAIMKIGPALAASSDAKAALDGVFGSTRTADRTEFIYQVQNGKPVEVNGQ